MSDFFGCHPVNDQSHDFSFPIRQAVDQTTNFVESAFLLSSTSVFLDRGGDATFQAFNIKRLFKEVDRAHSKTLGRVLNAGVPGHEKNRDADIPFPQFLLKPMTVHAGKAQIEYQASDVIVLILIEKVFRRSKRNYMMPNLFETPNDGPEDNVIVVHDVDNGLNLRVHVIDTTRGTKDLPG